MWGSRGPRHASAEGERRKLLCEQPRVGVAAYHELRRANHRRRPPVLDERDQAEVAEYRPPLRGEQYILGLYVAVRNVERVQLRERKNDAARIKLHVLGRQLP